MKALLIKYHGPTNTKGSRLSVQSEGFKPEYEPCDHACEQDFDEIVKDLAKRYFEGRFRIDTTLQSFAIGVLPNGDYAAVLI
jgi:hypothetical protein